MPVIKIRKSEKQCRDCAHWEQIDIPGHEKTIADNPQLLEGVCRARCPQVVVMPKPNIVTRQLDMGFMSLWPQVAGECPCCGDFVADTEER
jgi:hypothetical protein